MKTITLQTAVMLEIANLLFAGAPFSAYNVTQNIRVKVDDEYDLSDVEKDGDLDDDDEWVEFTPIEHDQVKALVRELYENGFIDATKKYNSKGYIEYVPNTAIVITNNTITNSSPTNVSPYYDKINDYLTSHGPATIKQIQSALKVKGLLCEDIAKVLPQSSIVQSDPYISNIVVRGAQ